MQKLILKMLHYLALCCVFSEGYFLLVFFDTKAQSVSEGGMFLLQSEIVQILTKIVKSLS